MKKVLEIALLVAFIYGFILMHEQAHVEISKNYGISSDVRIGLFYGETKPNLSDVHLTREEWSQLNFLHSLNEIIGYNLFVCFLFLLTYLIIRGDWDHQS